MLLCECITIQLQVRRQETILFLQELCVMSCALHSMDSKRSFWRYMCDKVSPYEQLLYQTLWSCLRDGTHAVLLYVTA
jgi:hypothetical protein